MSRCAWVGHPGLRTQFRQLLAMSLNLLQSYFGEGGVGAGWLEQESETPFLYAFSQLSPSHYFGLCIFKWQLPRKTSLFYFSIGHLLHLAPETTFCTCLLCVSPIGTSVPEGTDQACQAACCAPRRWQNSDWHMWVLHTVAEWLIQRTQEGSWAPD